MTEIPTTGDPEIERAVRAMLEICPAHQKGVDPDCGNCGSRQEAVRIYLVGLIDDVRKAFGL